MSNLSLSQKGFTVVELAISITIIGILAAVSFVSYNGSQDRAAKVAIQSDLRAAASQLESDTTWSKSGYPATAGDLPISEGTSYSYISDSKMFCLTATSERQGVPSFYVTNDDSTIREGVCPFKMQAITTANCPAARTRAVDVRDNRSYWVQKLADGRCWMLTNLAYAGGGVNTYGDAKTLQNGTGDSSTTYTTPKYYVPTGANPTDEPTDPSVSTDGGATNPQYGYLYNVCAAFGGQIGTSACANATTPLPDTATSICAAGWRLPSGAPSTGEFEALTAAIGATDNPAGVAALRATWLAQKAGHWDAGFTIQGIAGRYWSSSFGSADASWDLYSNNSIVYPANSDYKYTGGSVRCIAI